MKDKKSKKSKIDNNLDMKEILKENKNRMEIAKEIAGNKKIADVLGDRLSKSKRFPPC